MRSVLLGLLLTGAGVLPLAAASAQLLERPAIGPGEFVSVIPTGVADPLTHVERFRLDRRPVTNAEFLAFLARHPEWRRGRVPTLFADGDYLSHWAGPGELGARPIGGQPVTRVSWFAARAYCQALGARLPTWREWEFAAAADARRADARADAAWQASILDWYALPASRPLPNAGLGAANFYGIQDLHGLVWEWVEDFNALTVSGDSREQGDPDRLAFCGAGALSLKDRSNYPVLMRIAFLSSLEARSSARSLGFRCAAGAPQASPEARLTADSAGGESLQQLPVRLETSDGASLSIADLAGRPLLVTMFYSSCSSACPLVTAELARLLGQLPAPQRRELRVLMVSLDSERDTPATLAAFRAEHHLAGASWIVARASPEDVRLLAAALGIRYRKLPDGSFNHSSVISVVDRLGRVRARSSELLHPDARFMQALRTQARGASRATALAQSP